jgi:hypothetical protein
MFTRKSFKGTNGGISSVTIFRAKDYTYYTIAMSTDDAEYLNNRR